MKENCGSTSERLHKSPFSMSKTERSSIQRCFKHLNINMEPCRDFSPSNTALMSSVAASEEARSSF